MRAIAMGVLVSGLWLAPLWAWAQPAAPGSPQPRPEETAAARALADRLIGGAGAAEVFENVTHTDMARVRHRPSGTHCVFSGEGDRLALHNGVHIRLNGYTCETMLDGALTEWTVLDLPAPPQMAIDAALAALKDAIPDIGPSTEQFGDMTPMGPDDKPLLPPSVTRRLEGTREGHPVFVRLQAISWPGWNGTLQTTAPKGDNMRTDLLAGMTFINVMSGANGLGAPAAQ